MLGEFRETFKSISNFELTGTYTIYQHNSNQSDHIRNLGWLISSADLNITVSYLSSFMANVSLSSDNCSNFFIKTPDNHKVIFINLPITEDKIITLTLYTQSRTLWIALAFQVATSLVDPFTRKQTVAAKFPMLVTNFATCDWQLCRNSLIHGSERVRWYVSYWIQTNQQPTSMNKISESCSLNQTKSTTIQNIRKFVQHLQIINIKKYPELFMWPYLILSLILLTTSSILARD